MPLTPLKLAHQIIEASVEVGETVIDGTLGNGHDALFLSQLVGENGLLIGFDVQQEALDATRSRLMQHGIERKSFQLHLDGHENLLEYTKGPISAVMFNLGYLPMTDKSVITQPDTTLEALQHSLRVLRHKGVMTVMCYPGHAGGAEEVQAIEKWSAQLPRDFYRVMSYKPVNAPNSPAFLIVIEKS